jgi:hypothetical protein
VVASRDVGKIEGSTRGEGSADAKCEILARSEESGQFFTTEADSQGRFVLTGLAPGGYYLYAWPILHDVEYANENVLRRYEAYRRRVLVMEGATETGIELQLITGEMRGLGR